jgi:hypothetical protein
MQKSSKRIRIRRREGMVKYLIQTEEISNVQKREREGSKGGFKVLVEVAYYLFA